MRYVICYDVTDDRRRARLVKCLLDYGSRVQYSVFEAVLDAPLLERMKREAAALLDPSEDGMVVYPLCARCEAGTQWIGRRVEVGNEEVFIY